MPGDTLTVKTLLTLIDQLTLDNRDELMKIIRPRLWLVHAWTRGGKVMFPNAITSPEYNDIFKVLANDEKFVDWFDDNVGFYGIDCTMKCIICPKSQYHTHNASEYSVAQLEEYFNMVLEDGDLVIDELRY